jgi:hypothetical protein
MKLHSSSKSVSLQGPDVLGWLVLGVSGWVTLALLLITMILLVASSSSKGGGRVLEFECLVGSIDCDGEVDC